MLQTTLTLLTGAIIGIGLVVACSDDSPGTADAAECNCPAAEPPVPARLMEIKATSTIAANSANSAGASCPPNSRYISGQCGYPGGASRDAYIQLSQRNAANQHICTFQNNEPNPIEVEAVVLCLVP